MNESLQKKILFFEEKLSTILLKIRITPNAKGYPILKEVVLQISLDSSKKLNMNKTLYPVVAKNYNVSVSQIERRLKSLCDACKRDSMQSDLENVFGSQNLDTFSVKQVICSLAERLKLEYRAMMHQNNCYVNEMF